MNLQTEQSVRDWLASLEAFEGIAIHCGQSDDEIPSDEPLITVACEDINTPAATLYIASLRIIIGSPSVIEGSLDSHRSLVANLRATLADAEDMAAEQFGATIMEMTVIDIRDELIAFYERRGYARTGIKKPFPYGDARFGLPLRDDLRDAKDYYADKAKAAAESVGDVINRAADAFRDAFKTAASAVTMGDDVPPPPPPASPPPPPAPEPPVGV